jgi:hypothetical protein
VGCPCRKKSAEPAVTSAQLLAEAQIRAGQDPEGAKAAQLSTERAVSNARS